MSDGDPGAAEELLPMVYDELHRIADRLMTGERNGHTLQPTALINEAFMKVGGINANGWEGRSHFLRVAAKAMRRVLIDHARAEATQKRQGRRQAVTLHDHADWSPGDAEQVLAVHEGVRALAEIDGKLANIVELRFFGGLSNQEIAGILDSSLRSVERGWQFARSWLRQFFERAGEANA